MKELFHKFASSVSKVTGSAYSFMAALLIVVVWMVSGPLFNFSDTWQLVINTGTTIITFLMVFLIQNTQNRDTEVIQLKLDELIRAVETARNDLIDLEDLTDAQVERLKEQFKHMHQGEHNPENNVRANSTNRNNSELVRN